MDALEFLRRLAGEVVLPADLAAWAWQEQKRRVRQLTHANLNSDGRVIGQHHHRAKLSDDDVELIRTLRESGMRYADIAAKWDDAVRISERTVAAICRGERRAHTVMGHKRVGL